VDPLLGWSMAPVLEKCMNKQRYIEAPNMLSYLYSSSSLRHTICFDFRLNTADKKSMSRLQPCNRYHAKVKY
jgi:hypothetical protein